MKTVIINVVGCCDGDEKPPREPNRIRLTWGLGVARFTFWPRRKSKSMAEINESSLGLDAVVAFFKADGVTPAIIDGPPRWTLNNSAAGDPVGTLTVDTEDPYHAIITPLPVPATVVGPAHSAEGSVEGDGDLDAGEERLVTAVFVVTVRRDEAQSAGVTLTEIPAPPPGEIDNTLPTPPAQVDNTLPSAAPKKK